MNIARFLRRFKKKKRLGIKFASNVKISIIKDRSYYKLKRTIKEIDKRLEELNKQIVKDEEFDRWKNSGFKPEFLTNELKNRMR